MLMTTRDETATGRAVGSILLDVPGTVTVRELIRLRVREEVARHNAQPTECFHGQVLPTRAEEDLNGHRMRTPARIDWERQADAAVTAFGRDGFIVLVADRQVEELDDEVDLDKAPMSRSSGWSRWSADDRHSHQPAPQSGEPVSRGRWHQGDDDAVRKDLVRRDLGGARPRAGSWLLVRLEHHGGEHVRRVPRE